MPTGEDEQTIGLREYHKLDKVRRISSSARKLFGQAGYEATTLRQIAHDAHVALGTLSSYAADKRDLVVLLFNQEIPTLVQLGKSASHRKRELVSATTAFFDPFYRTFAGNRDYYRILLRDNVYSLSSQHARELVELRLQMITAIAGLVSAAQERGEIRADRDALLVGRSFFFVYFGAVRWWISSPEPDAEEGIAELRELLKIHVDGLRLDVAPRNASARR